MSDSSFKKAGFLTLILVIGLVIGWELFVHDKGLINLMMTKEPLWANKRAMLYEPPG